MEELTQGEIYIAQNIVNGKAYVGKAEKYITNNKQKWGHLARWKRHEQEALNINNAKGRFSHINNAIREFGFDKFKITKVCDCDLSEINELEQKYIKEYNTLDPNGYNMTEGGSTGRHSYMANQKKKVPRNITNEERYELQHQIMETPVANPNFYDQDKDLPKYLSCSRKNDKVIGYKLTFPIGIETRELVKKTFTNTAHPEKALEDAKKFLADLHDKKNKLLEEFNSSGQKIQIKLPVLPDYIFHDLFNDKINGYYVDGLQDCKGIPIPRRIFNENQNNYNLDRATKFIKLVLQMNESEKIARDWLTLELPKTERPTNLPTHIRLVTYKGEPSGYRVDYFLRHENGKAITDSKTFTTMKFSMDEKLELAKNYVEELKKKYTKSALNSELEKSASR